MSPDESRLADLLSAVPLHGDLWVILNDLAEGNPLTDEEIEEASTALGHRVVEGEAPPDAVEAFTSAAEDTRRRYERDKAAYRKRIAKRGARAVGETVDGTDWTAFSAYMDADAELHKARNVAPVGGVLIRNPRARESRPRPTRSSSSSSRSSSDDPPSSSDDPPLADVPRACPRCGCVPRPLLPHSALWSCDFCADVIWEQLVQHELRRVLREAEEITKRAAAT